MTLGAVAEDEARATRVEAQLLLTAARRAAPGDLRTCAGVDEDQNYRMSVFCNQHMSQLWREWAAAEHASFGQRAAAQSIMDELKRLAEELPPTLQQVAAPAPASASASASASAPTDDERRLAASMRVVAQVADEVRDEALRLYEEARTIHERKLELFDIDGLPTFCAKHLPATWRMWLKAPQASSHEEEMFGAVLAELARLGGLALETKCATSGALPVLPDGLVAVRRPFDIVVTRRGDEVANIGHSGMLLQLFGAFEQGAAIAPGWAPVLRAVADLMEHVAKDHRAGRRNAELVRARAELAVARERVAKLEAELAERQGGAS